jgi:glycine/D-amino acid oxidase-like deaminating enzyme
MPRTIGPTTDASGSGSPGHDLPDPRAGRAATRRVLIATPVGTRITRAFAGSGTVLVRPELLAAPGELGNALVALRPHTLIVGSNRVDGVTLARWAAAMRGEARVPVDRRRRADGRAGRHGDPRGGWPLLLIRRGTSVASIDVDGAARCGVQVRNTAEVNARYIARFTLRALFPEPAGRAATGRRDDRRSRPPAAGGAPAPAALHPGTVGLVGAGNINTWVARGAAARGCRIVVFSPSLAADPAARERWCAARGLPADGVVVAPDVAAVFGAADLISIAVPLVRSGPHRTTDLIRPSHLKAFAGRRIVSVSEPDVLSDEAALEAYARRDIEVVLDSAVGLRPSARQQIADRFSEDGEALRTGFTLTSDAVHMPGCGEELDQAILVAAARAEVAQLGTTPGGTRPAGGEVVVVGGGIVGLTVALTLHAAGRDRVRLLDAGPGAPGRAGAPDDLAGPEPADRAGPGGGGRPAAAAGAPGSPRGPDRAWLEAFDWHADRPGLRELTDGLAAELDRLGRRGWRALLPGMPDDHPDIDGLAATLRHRLEAAGVPVHRARVARIDRTVAGVRLTLADGSTVTAGTAVLTMGGPALRDLIGDSWTGGGAVQGGPGGALVPATAPDGLPVLDALAPLDGRVVVAAGSTRAGAAAVPALAALLARLLDGDVGCAHLALAASRPGLPRSR